MFADKRIIVVGGMGDDENALDSIEELSEDGTHWTQMSKELQSSTEPTLKGLALHAVYFIKDTMGF